MEKTRSSLGTSLKKLLLIMKLSTFIMILAAAQTLSAATSSLKAQSTNVSLNLNNVQVKEVIKTIEKQSDYRFFYTEGLSDMSNRVSVNAEGKSIEMVLAEVLASTNLGFKVNDKTVVIAPKETLQQQGKVKGNVLDASGMPLVGVSVSVKGTSTGTVTDIDGNYSLNIPGPDAVLVFSYIGYDNKEVKVGTQTSIDVVLKEDAKLLDEVVVVGYGTQKKANLTGAVASIGNEKIENRPITTLSSALSGLASGVSVQQKSGNPGSDDANIRIRGAGTFNNDDRGPMIIIDGALGTMDSVNPDDVESISVLKDAASAAIYGSRAANGVILITTKKGKQEAAPRVTYTGIFSSEQPSNTFDFMTDYATYMEVFNRAQMNVGSTTQRYTQAAIDEWRSAAKNPNSTDNQWGIPNWLAYPNTDWNKALFQNNLFQNHNLSVTGGSKNSNYLLSLMYMDNPGTMDNTGVKKYQFRVNLESKIADFLKLGTNTYASKQEKEAGNSGGAFDYMFQTIPGMTPEYDGKYGGPEYINEDGTANNLLWFLNNTGGTRTTTRINTNWYAVADLYKGLTLEGRFNYQDYRYDTDTYPIPTAVYSLRTGVVQRPGTSLANAVLSYDGQRSYQYTANAILNYVGTFGDHSVNGMLGYEQFYYNYKGIYAQKHGLMDFSIVDMSTASAMDRITGLRDPDDNTKDNQYGGQYDYAMVSYFGRLNYSFKNRYLFEANFRTDYSSRFSPDNRRGTFPSFSGAWRVSEESFMEGTKGILSDLKLRASWGQLGNTTSGYYAWQSNYAATGNNYSFGGNVLNGLSVYRLGNSLLQWEKSTTTGIGLDAFFLNQRLGLEFDYYNRLTEGILTDPAMPLTMGTVRPPYQNTADMKNQGIEISLGWNDRINDFSYSAKVMFAYNQNEVTNYLGNMKEGFDEKGVYQSNIGATATFLAAEPTKIRTEGHIIDEYYVRSRYKGTGTYKDGSGNVDPNGGPRDGMIRTPQDLQWVNDMKAAGYSFGVNTVGKTGLYYGEFIMADVNGDKIYGNSYDREFTGKSATPKYTYGLTLAAGWKGFDLSMNWAGQGGMYYYVNERAISSSNIGNRTAMNADAVSMYYYYNETNPSDPANNINGKYPRLRYDSNGAHIDNEFYLYNASYVKLKNLQIGYTFPKQLVNKVHINNLRLFLSGENLVTITDFPGVDPEMGAGVNVYPTNTQYAVGVNLTF